MGIFSRIGSWFTKVGNFLQKGVGEKVFARILPGLGSYGLPGGWTSDRLELARHMSGWNYIAIRAIAEEGAGNSPHIGYIRSPEDAHRRREKGLAHPSRFLTKSQRRKALVQQHLQPHEELELVDSDHRLYRLLAHPNDTDTAWTHWYRTYMWLELTGNCYWWLIPANDGLPAEIWCLPSHWVWPNPERRPGHLVDWYDIRPYGVAVSRGVRLPAREIIHFAYPNPISMFDGLAPLQAGSIWSDVGEALEQCWWTSLKEGHRPGLIIELQDKDGQGSNPSQQDLKRFYEQLDQRLASEHNHRKSLVLSPGASVAQDNTKTNVEMDFIHGAELIRDWELALYRTPKTIAGLSDNVNFATIRATAANFARWTIKPKFTMVAGVVTEGLAKRFDEQLVVYYPDPTQEDPEQVNRDIDIDARNGATTPNEIRTKRGLEPLDDPIADLPVPLALAKWRTAGQPAPGPGGPGLPGGAAPPDLPGMNGSSNGSSTARPQLPASRK